MTIQVPLDGRNAAREVARVRVQRLGQNSGYSQFLDEPLHHAGRRQLLRSYLSMVSYGLLGSQLGSRGRARQEAHARPGGGALALRGLGSSGALPGPV